MRSHFGAQNLGAKQVPLSGPKTHETRPKQCGSGTIVVKAKSPLVKHRFASTWTRRLCACFKEGGKEQLSARGEGILPARSPTSMHLVPGDELASPMLPSYATGPTSSLPSRRYWWGTRRHSWCGIFLPCRQLALGMSTSSGRRVPGTASS